MLSFSKKNTELCKYILNGEKCPYERCNYAHKKEDLRDRKKPTSYKHVMCKNWLRYGSCRYGDKCNFNHDENVKFKKQKVLKIKKHYLFKTTLCENLIKRGFCCYGENCMYIHDYKTFHRTNMRKSLNIIKRIKCGPTVEYMCGDINSKSFMCSEDYFVTSITYIPENINPYHTGWEVGLLWDRQKIKDIER
jgi:hypothetical protein